MASVNRCIFIGNLGRDPETKYMESGDAVTNISIGVSETWKDKSGEKKEKTEWVRAVFFGKLAEIVTEYCKKGDSIYVEGKMSTRKWTDKEGNEKYTTEVICDRMQMLGNRKESGGDKQERPAAQQKPAAQTKNQQIPEDDDIPF